MKKTVKIFNSILLLLILLVAGVLFADFSNIVLPWQRQDAIETTLSWGGLAELPKEAENLKVEGQGNMFTRTFIIEFEADQKEIEDWILISKRLKDNQPELNGQIKTYEIYPGEEESMGGKVTIDKEKVTIKMSWS